MRRIVLLFPLLVASAWAQCAGGAGVITSPSTCGGCSGGGGGGGSVSWGAIVGTLGNQLDLAAALNAKQNTIASYATISGLLGYPSAFNPVNTGDWAGSWNSHAVSYFQTAISGAPGSWPSTFPPINSGDWAGTWQTHQPSYFQPALSAYSTISGLSGYPSTFPPINTGDWAGTWQGQSPGAWGRYFSATRTSGAVLTLGADCTSANPCPVRVGNTTYRLTSSATVTLSAGAGSGRAQVYVVSGGALTVGHNLTGADVTCGGCTAVSSVTNPPVPSTLLWTWTATSSTWDTSGGTDFRAAYSTQNVQAGSAGGVAVSTSGDATTVEQDPATIYGYAPARTGTIGSLPGTCGAGEQYFATDAPPGANLYFCTAPNTWRPLTPSVRSDFFSWNVVPGTAWASAGAQTATLAPVPAGVNGANSSHNLYISDGANSEVVTITGGTAVSGAASGTITFTTAHAHNNTVWTLGSATAGIKEASEYLVSGGTIHVPAGNSTMRAAAAITKSAIKIVGDGGWSASYDDTSHGSVLVNHSNTADVIQIGDASNHTYGFQLESVGFTTDTYAVSGAATDGGLIKLTIAPHEFSTGDKVYVRNVGGVTAANGYWTATVVDGTHIDLQGSTFSGAYSSGGAVYRSKTAGSAIHLYSFSNASVRDVTIRHHYQPVLVGYGDNFHLDTYIINGTTPDVISSGSAGIAINTAGNEVFVGEGVIDMDEGVWSDKGGPCDISYGFCPNQEPYAGILMLQGSGIYVDGASVIHGGHGLLVIPNAGTAVTWAFVVNSTFDTGSGDNLIQPNGSGASVYGMVLANDWFTNNNNTGLTISQYSSGVLDGVQISNARVFDNRQNGIYLAAGSNLQIGSESQICGNGLGSSNTYDGLAVGAGASHWSFGNSTSGTCSGFGTNQRYGVNIVASGPYFRVVGNDLSGNATGGFANTSGAANGIVSNNLGYNPVGAGSISVTGSPFTYTAGPSPEVVYINGGTVSGVVRGSSTICAASPCQATLPPNGAVVVTYSSAPTMVKDVQ